MALILRMLTLEVPVKPLKNMYLRPTFNAIVLGNKFPPQSGGGELKEAKR
jgi:hypothetical protein